MAQAEKKKYTADNPGKNYIDSIQGRFLYSDKVEYQKEKIYDHMTVGTVWHYDKIHERIGQGYGAALNYGICLEKELTKTHALRLLFYEGTYQQNEKSIRMDKYQLELLHSFNWVRFFGGYNPYRKIEAVSSLGLGAFYSERLDNTEVGALLIASAGARLQLSPLFILGVEPYVALSSDGIDHSGSRNYRKYDVLYGTDVSLSYTFHHDLNKEERRQYRGNTFVDFGIGVQFEPYSGFHLKPNELGFFETAGPQLKLGVGHWLTPGLAVRAMGNLSSSNWDNVHVENDIVTGHPAHDIRLKNVLANARLDLMLSPYHFLSGRVDNRFDLNAIVGWEYGWMIKTSYSPADLLMTYYNGFSGGLQLRYNYDQHTALYIEPRVTLANYTIPYAAPYQHYVDRYRDYLLSVSAGFEFSSNEHRLLSRHQQPSIFTPHFSLSLQGGPSYTFVTKEYAGDAYVDYTAGITGELHFSPYSGVRITTDYAQITNRDKYYYSQQLNVGSLPVISDTALCTVKYGSVNVSAEYLFNIGTLLQGYNVDNRWNVAFSIGPVYSQRVNEKTIISKDEILWEWRNENAVANAPEIKHPARDYALGFQIGIPVSFRIGSHWDLQFEPRARFFPNNYIDQTRSGGLSKNLNTQIGLRYTFNERFYMRRNDSISGDFELKPGHLFFHTAAGAQSSHVTSQLGPRFEVGAGYWLNPGIAARLSFGITSHDWATAQTTLLPVPGKDGEQAVIDLRQDNIGGRIDILLNPYGYLSNRYDNLFGTNLVFGWEYGTMHRANMLESTTGCYKAVSGGFQLRYNCKGHRSFYVEPRYSYNLTTRDGQASLVGGWEIGATEHAFRPGSLQSKEFNSSHAIMLSSGGGYLCSGKAYANSLDLGYSGGITGEYRISPYSGARFTIGYAHHTYRDLYEYHYEDYGLSQFLYNYSLGYLYLGGDYLFDLTTLLQGYAADRRWNIDLAAGLLYEMQLKRHDPASNKGYELVEHKSPSKHRLGLQLGIPLTYRLTKHWALAMEPRLQLFGRNYTAPPHMCNGNLTKIINIQLGMKYTF